MKVDHKTIFEADFSQRERWVVVLCIALLIPALLINLGYMTVIDDEAIRAVVALEMWYSGEYIAPTINGRPYLNKPPLYNWIILISYQLFGKATEFTSRFPTVIFTFIYGYLVYHLYRKVMGNNGGIVIAFLTITCGRMFFYDTFLGLIDICFSMCMFSLMIGSYFLAKEEKWNMLFIFSYTLAAIGFLLKTYPAIVFLGLSLLVILISEKQFKKFFTVGHFLGISIFSILVFGYYFIYSLDNNIVHLLVRMFTESSDRTVVKFGILKTIQHLFTFPFELFYHFLPWTILVVYLFKKGAIKTLWAEPFIRMNILLLGANIILYWTSPQVYARYLLMFPPLMFAPLYYLHIQNKEEKSIHYKIVKALLYLIIIIIVIACSSIFFVDRIQFVPNIFVKASIVCCLCAAAIFLLWKANRFHLIYVFLFMIVFRIGFDWFVFPDRNVNDYGNKLRMSAIEFAKKYDSEGIYTDSNFEMNRSVTYYITRQNEKIVPAVEEAPRGVLISDKAKTNCVKVDDLKSRTRNSDYLILKCN